MNKNTQLANFILTGIKAMNNITENIDLNKTTLQYIQKQLPISLNDSFIKVKFSPDQSQIEETFFTFLKENDNLIQHLKIFNLVPNQEQYLKDHISYYFKNINRKYNEDKMFYFYFQLVIMEKFLDNVGRDLPGKDLKLRLEETLKNDCLIEKKKISQCLHNNLEEIDVVVMSDFDEKIKRRCEAPKREYEQCIFKKITQ